MITKEETKKTVSLVTALLLKSMRYPRKNAKRSYFIGKSSNQLEYGELLDFPPIKGNTYSIAAPSYLDVMVWLMDKRNVFVEITIDRKTRTYRWKVCDISKNADVIVDDGGFGIGDYCGCCDNAIASYCMKVLERK